MEKRYRYNINSMEFMPIPDGSPEEAYRGSITETELLEMQGNIDNPAMAK